MTPRNELHELKATAKRIARAMDTPHHSGLDLVAMYLTQPHWNALTIAWDKGWRPSAEALEALVTAEFLIESESLGISAEVPNEFKEHGEIDGHPYTIESGFEVLMGGQGWRILVEHAPSKTPTIEAYSKEAKALIRDPLFIEKALAMCNVAAEKLRARSAAEWPKQSMTPDADGNVQHPLTKSTANEWFCLHCDCSSTGVEMARNMWHCPKCSANPLDMHSYMWWKEPVAPES